MVRKALGLLLVCLFAGVSHSEGTCELSKKGVSLRADESYSDDDECIRYTCNKDGLLEEERCQRPDPATFPDKRCKTVERKGIFPNCCPQVQCPKGANLDEVKFIQKRSAEIANLIVKRFGPVSGKTMPDQFVVKRHWQPGDIAKGIGAGFGGAVRDTGKAIGKGIHDISCWFFGCNRGGNRPPPDGNAQRPGIGNLNMGVVIQFVFRLLGIMSARMNVGDMRSLEFAGVGNIGPIPFAQFSTLHDLNTGDLKGMSLGDMSAFSPTGAQGVSVDNLRALGLNVNGLSNSNNISLKNLFIIFFTILGNMIGSGKNAGDFGRLRLGGRDLKSINFEELNFGDLGKYSVGDLDRFHLSLSGEMEGWGNLGNFNFLTLILIFLNGYRTAHPNAPIPQIPVAGRPPLWLKPDGFDLQGIDLRDKHLGNVILYILHLLGNLKGKNIGDLENLRIQGIGGTNIKLQDIGNMKGLNLGILQNLKLDNLKGVHSGDVKNLGAVADFKDLSLGRIFVMFLKGLVNLGRVGNLGDLNTIRIWNHPLDKVNLDALHLGDLERLKLSDLGGLDFGSFDPSHYGSLGKLDWGSLLLLFLKRLQNENIPEANVGRPGGNGGEGSGGTGSGGLGGSDSGGSGGSGSGGSGVSGSGGSGGSSSGGSGDSGSGGGKGSNVDYKIIGSWGNILNLDIEKLKKLGIDPEDLKKFLNNGNGGNSNLGNLKIEVLSGQNGKNLKQLQGKNLDGAGGGTDVAYRIINSGNSGDITLEGIQGKNVGGGGGTSNINYKIISSGNSGDINQGEIQGINAVGTGSGSNVQVKYITSEGGINGGGTGIGNNVQVKYITSGGGINGGGTGGGNNVQVKYISGSSGDINLQDLQNLNVAGSGKGSSQYKVIKVDGDGGNINFDELLRGTGVGTSNIQVIGGGDLSGMSLDDIKARFNIQ